MADKSGIYIIEFETGIYVGSSKHVRRRILRHLRDLALGQHSNGFMQNVYHRHGVPKCRMVVQCRDVDLLMYEQLLIDGLRPRLNLSPTAGRNLGHKHDPETLARMSAAAKAAWITRPRLVPIEQRQKISKSSVGRQFSTETRARISVAKKGHSVSVAVREKISATKRRATT